MNELDGIRKEENRIASQIERLAGPAIDLFEEACEACLLIFGLAAESASMAAKERALLGLYARMFNNLWGGFHLLKRGFYYQAFMGQRAALEDLLMTRYLSSHPEKASAWLEGRQFSPGEIRKRLAAINGADSEEMLVFKKTYSALSAMAHSSIDGTAIFEKRKGRKKDTWVAVGPTIDRDWIRLGLPGFIAAVLAGIKEIRASYSRTLPLQTECDEVRVTLAWKLARLPRSCSSIKIAKHLGEIR